MLLNVEIQIGRFGRQELISTGFNQRINGEEYKIARAPNWGPRARISGVHAHGSLGSTRRNFQGSTRDTARA